MKAALRLCVTLVLREAPRALLRHPMRTALSALGVAIGTGAVVCVVAIGRAGTRHAEEQLAKLGDNLVWLEAGSRNAAGVRTGTRGMESLTLSDAEAIREVPGISRVTPNVDGTVQVVHGDRNWLARYRGVNADYLAIKDWPIAEGDGFTDDEVERAEDVCVLGQTTREQLFGPEAPVLGEEILVATRICRVIGVLSRKGQSATGQDQDDTILMPYTTVQRKIRGKGIEWLDDILCSATSPQAVATASDAIRALLRDRHHIGPDQDDDFNIRRPDELIKAEIEARHTMAVFLVSVAAVSLLVGGIGIMNVMLASVTERTREIGVRLAVGAKAWSVQAQFLAEALLLSLFGGACGVALGVIASLLLGDGLGWPVTVPPLAMVLAPAFSVAVGIAFGVWPAVIASKLDPIAALAHE